MRTKFLFGFVVVLVGLGFANASRKNPTAPGANVSAAPVAPAASVPKQAQATPAPSAAPIETTAATTRRMPLVEEEEATGSKYVATGTRDTAEILPTKAPGRDDVDLSESAGPKLAGRPLSEVRNQKRTLPEIFGMPDPAPVQATAAAQGSEVALGQRQSSAPVPAQAKDRLDEDFAPFGRLIRCHLVNTIDSLTPTNVPIIAMTDDDLYWNGKLIIPANTEVFAYVSPNPQTDVRGVGRVFDQGEWTLVLPAQGDRINGREWSVKGRALDRSETVIEPEGRVRSWSISDMAPGLIGHTINTLDEEEVKLFVAAFLGEAASGTKEALQSRESLQGQAGQNGYTQVVPNLRNAVIGAIGSGTASLFERAVARIEEEIKRRGFYVRVPAGHQFYLFIEQTLDPRTQKVGIRIAGAEPDPTSQDVSTSPKIQ